MTVPCDCSISWLGNMEKCGFTIDLDAIPCGLGSLADIATHLQCPGKIAFC